MSTELGYLHAYLDYIGRNGKNAAGYSDFIITCLYSRLGDIDNALKYAKQAKKLFEKAYTDFPSRTWAKTHVEYCTELILQRKEGEVKALLEKWYEFSINNLGLNLTK